VKLNSATAIWGFIPLFAVLTIGCSKGGGGGSGGGGGGSHTVNCATSAGSATTKAIVNGSSISNPGGASQAIYFKPKNGDITQNANAPFVDVTVCPGTPYNAANCVTVPNILLDTGSYGLRIFKSALKEYFPTITIPASTTGDCIQFGSGATWGGVVPAFATLGGLTTTGALQMQVIDTSFGTSSNCVPPPGTLLAEKPSQFGLNGILGVGTLQSECVDGTEGLLCALGSTLAHPDPGGGVYFNCPSGFAGGACTAHDVATSSQVRNPVSYLPAGHNNGIIIELPAVPSNGAPGGASAGAAVGYVVFGIPSTTNASLQVFNTDNFSEFATDFAPDIGLTAFLDSGSNALYLPTSDVGIGLSSLGWANPSSSAECSGVTIAYTNGSQGFIQFEVANSDSLFMTGNYLFNNLASQSADFDWGLPVFLGRNVFIGIDVATASINGSTVTGPYWAY
jgi:hypothetical protein